MIIAFPNLPIAQVGKALQPCTWAQAQEIGRRFYIEAHAAPTVAHQMGIPYDVVCDVLAGKVWPASRRFWMDNTFP